MEAAVPRPVPVQIADDAGVRVSGLLYAATQPVAACTLAPGAGAGMAHPFMVAVAEGLARRRVTTLLFQFPFMEAGSRRPDRPAVAQATVRVAVAAASLQAAGLPLFAGGKSFGGRMTSQAQADAPLADVRGLFFLGFPLHLAKQPALTRAAHLEAVRIPMLFLQGTRDALAEPTLMRQVADGLPSATLHELAEADHGMHVPKRTGRSDGDVLADALDTLAAWMAQVAETR